MLGSCLRSWIEETLERPALWQAKMALLAKG
jgi:hypothetical protein